MALYVSVGRRRLRAVVAAIVVGVLAFGTGLLIGRQQVASVGDRVRTVQSNADQIATGLDRLDVEYANVVAGTESLAEAVLAPLDETITDAQHALDEAPWLTSQQRAAIVDALAITRASAQANDPADVFDGHLADTATLVRTTFGVSG